MKRKIVSLLLLLVLALSLAALPASAAGGTYVYDVAGVLSEEQARDLAGRASLASESGGCGIYIVIVQKYSDYGSGTIDLVAQSIYNENGFGLGAERSGLLLLLSLDERDYDLSAYGYGLTAFTDYGRDLLSENLRSYFRDNDWYGGLSAFVNESAEMLTAANNGTPVDRGSGELTATETAGGIFGILLLVVALPCLVALIAVSIMKRGMKSVAHATAAKNYMVPGSLDLRVSSDNFSHVTETRRKIETESKRGGGGGSTVNSDGFAHTTGKF